MSTLVESLKRLYSSNKITLDKIDALKASGKISLEEYAYITSE